MARHKQPLEPTRDEQTFTGLGVSPGIALGYVHRRESGAVDVPEYSVPVAKLAEEIARFKKAVKLARRQVSRLRSKAKGLPGSAAEELGFLLDAYLHMLKGSRLVRGVERRIFEERINAESAVQAELSEISAAFSAMEDAYIAARLDDIREVALRLIRNLTRASHRSLRGLPKNTVIIAEELTPADTAQMDPKVVCGFAAMLGGAEGHTAIMARALELPAVVGVTGLFQAAGSGDPVIVDGDTGTVTLRPTEATLAVMKARKRDQMATKRRLARLIKLPAVTRDGVKIGLQANVELPFEMDGVARAGAEGIGLLRTEFIFMNRPTLPSEDEQYNIYKGMLADLDGGTMTIRTLDVGGDKIVDSLMHNAADDATESISSPLGLRGVRLSLARPAMFEAQIGAILRTAAHGSVRILLPMVSNTGEMMRARQTIAKVATRLKRRGVDIGSELPPLGAMIEVPGAALSADALARHSDFFAIGSNDLTMYTLAIDRSDEQVAYLYDSMHPAVLRLIHFSAMAALRARIPLSLCGELAGDPRYTALLLGLGIRDLSMIAVNIPRVKQRLREIDATAATQRASMIMEQSDPGRISMLLDDFNGFSV